MPHDSILIAAKTVRGIIREQFGDVIQALNTISQWGEWGEKAWARRHREDLEYLEGEILDRISREEKGKIKHAQKSHRYGSKSGRPRKTPSDLRGGIGSEPQGVRPEEAKAIPDDSVKQHDLLHAGSEIPSVS